MPDEHRITHQGAVPPGAQMQHTKPLSAGQYLGMLLLGLLPFVGLVACLLWAYSATAQPGRRNLARAMLWLHAAALVIAIIALALWVAALAGVPIPFF